MEIGETSIEDTFAEAFGMRYSRLIITADEDHWLRAALAAITGYASSVLGCDAEAGLEQEVAPSQTPDGRIGAAVLLFAFNKESLEKAIANRAGQCVLTCPTTALFNGLKTDDRLPLGRHLRFFGDGYQKSKMIDGTRYWRIPVMEGEFLCEESCGVSKGIAGGNFIIQGTTVKGATTAALGAVEAISKLPGVITPFPGGAVRSGSKVGSRYPGLRASTADSFCPTLRGSLPSRLHPNAQSAMEIVIDGVDYDSVANAMAAGIRAACIEGVVAISAGNYGGKLGPHHFKLHELLGSTP